MAAEKLELHLALRAFVQGMVVNWGTAQQATADTGFIEGEYRRALDAALAHAAGRHVHMERVVRELGEDFELDVERVFEVGLSALLDGVAIAIFRRKTA